MMHQRNWTGFACGIQIKRASCVCCRIWAVCVRMLATLCSAQRCCCRRVKRFRSVYSFCFFFLLSVFPPLLFFFAEFFNLYSLQIDAYPWLTWVGIWTISEIRNVYFFLFLLKIDLMMLPVLGGLFWNWHSFFWPHCLECFSDHCSILF